MEFVLRSIFIVIGDCYLVRPLDRYERDALTAKVWSIFFIEWQSCVIVELVVRSIVSASKQTTRVYLE